MNDKVTEVAARALPEPLLKVEDLERLLRVDKRTIARLCKRGVLPAPLKLGGGIRWRTEDVANTIDVLAIERDQVHQREEDLAAEV